MLGSRLVVVGIAFALVAVARDSDACSCMGPQEALITPSRADDVPLNTKVRVEVPAAVNGQPASAGKIVLRAHGTTKSIDFTTRVGKQGDVDLHELSPLGGLAPSTQYEVAVIDGARHPSTTVIGTFKTGTTNDSTAPTLDSIAMAAPPNGATMMRTSCSVSGPRVNFESVSATDPNRANAQFLYGVWLGDATTGKVDVSKPPVRLLPAWQKSLIVGRSGGCQVHDFPFPTTQFAWLGLAVFDEAGNYSAVKTFRVDVKAVTVP